MPARRQGTHAPCSGLGVASHFLVGAASQGAREAFYPYYRAYFAQGRGTCLDRSTFEAMAGPDGALSRLPLAGLPTASRLPPHELETEPWSSTTWCSTTPDLRSGARPARLVCNYSVQSNN
jgi:hypothetical protein